MATAACSRGARPGMIFIDATTADPAVDAARSAPSSPNAARICSMPLSAGRRRRPRRASSAPMSAATPKIIERVRPILSKLRRHHRRLRSALGAGTTCKLVNNSITIGMAALIAEGFATAAKVGVDLNALADVLSAGGANGRMWQMIEPWIRAGDDSHSRVRSVSPPRICAPMAAWPRTPASRPSSPRR